MIQNNLIKIIDFAAPQIEAKWLSNASYFPIDQKTIVLNVGSQPVIINQKPIKSLLPHQSTILQNIEIIQGDSIILFKINTTSNIGNLIFQKGWQLGYDLFGDCLRNVPLWRSPQQQVGELELNQDQFCGQQCEGNQKRKFKVLINLWFCTAETHCGIHNHQNTNFIEYHTQLYGEGKMQRFKEDKYEALYEELIMSTGNSHNVWCNVENNQFVYPWHQYQAVTDCLWSVVELHPLN